VNTDDTGLWAEDKSLKIPDFATTH